MCKALRDGTDQFETLLELRNTSRQDTGLRPGEMMFSKKYPITTTVCRSADFPLRVTTTEVSETWSDSPLVNQFTTNARKEPDWSKDYEFNY